MKKVTLTILACSLMVTCAANSKLLSSEVEKKLSSIGLEVQSSEPTSIPGIHSITSKEGISYVSEDGEYIFVGNLFKINGKEVENITERDTLNGFRKSILKSKTITYKSPNEKIQVAVFTDISCSFCQQLHKNISDYLDAGITLKFLAFPRAGEGSYDATSMAKIWCSADPALALNEAMAKAVIPSVSADAQCVQIINEHYAMGNSLHVKGTPTMLSLTENPQVFNGLVKPDVLLPHSISGK